MKVLPSGYQPAGRAPAPAPLDLVQDFVNSEVPVWSIDDLATPEGLRDWLRARDLLDEGEVEAESFVRARALRGLLRDLASSNTRGEPDEALRAAFGAVGGDLPLRAVLDEHGELRLEPVAGGVDGALATIVATVLEAQAAGAWQRMKACPGPHCGWLFYDGSRNGSSTWCSMSICGNRTKTAAYRRRKAAT